LTGDRMKETVNGNELVDCYRSAIETIKPDGEPNFSDLVFEARERAKRSKETGTHNFIVPIILVGNYTHSSQASLSLGKSSFITFEKLPANAIVVEIGIEPLDILSSLKTKGKIEELEREVLTYVPFSMMEKAPDLFVKYVLGRITSQVVEYMLLNDIQPKLNEKGPSGLVDESMLVTQHEYITKMQLSMVDFDQASRLNITEITPIRQYIENKFK
jgi:hypothetical protein